MVPVALVALAGVGAGAFALTSGGRSAARGPTATTPAMPSVAEATTPAPSVETPVAAREVDVPPVVTAGTGARRATAASSAPSAPKPSVDRVVAANKSLYDRCQREALAENANAPRRYSVALTIDGDGRAEWVSVVSEASATMRSCVESVTRGLTFPRAASGSERSIVTLSFGAAPR